MLPAGGLEEELRGYLPACNTQSSAPEDGRDHCPKHVEIIGIINKPLLLHLVGCLYYYDVNLLAPELFFNFSTLCI